MKTKRVLVFGIALFLLTLVTGVAFAASLGGVDYWWDNSDTHFLNRNSYVVFVSIKGRTDGRNWGVIEIPANSKWWIAGEFIITKVSRTRNG
jgi:hypothetical protein